MPESIPSYRQHEPSLIEKALLGAVRSSALFPIEHCLEWLKLAAQATPERSLRSITAEIIATKGIKGFANTASINFPRRVLRESVRWPIIGFTQQFTVTTFPHHFPPQSMQTDILSGLVSSAFESIFILPLERLMAFRVKEGCSYKLFFREHFSREGFPSFYRAIAINFARQASVWTIFMAINSESKKRFDRWDPEKTHPFLRQSCTSLFIALGLITVVLPLDFLKVKIQMETALQQLSTLSAVQTVMRRHKFSHFYAGALPMIIHTFFHATVAGYIMDHWWPNKVDGSVN